MDEIPGLIEYADGSSRSSVLLRSPNALIDRYHHDFVSFLAIAQQLNLDFMPIPWQAALGALGQGGTSLVQQSNNIKATLSFAFKRTKPPVDEVYGESVNGHHKSRYGALISELLVLGHPAIRNHPNFAQVEGIAWDFEGHRVWPVIVSQKAQCGNLYDFSTSEDAKSVPFANKISTCLDVASAVATMHLNNIIHGDIKPQNLLVLPPQNRSLYSVQVADFGYSCIGSQEGDLVKLPLHQPWEAPEYHDRYFTIARAKRLDVYSFGLTCFWLLWDHAGAPDISLEDTIAKMKWDRSLVNFVQDYFETLETISPISKESLKEFFGAVLCDEEESRAVNWEYISGLLESGESNRRSNIKGPLLQTELADLHPDFSILRDVIALDRLDYRVKLYIEQCLEENFASPSCTDCSSNRKRQLEISRNIGFAGNIEPLYAVSAVGEDAMRENSLQLRAFLEHGPEAREYVPKIIDEHLILYDYDLVEMYVNIGGLSEAETYYRQELDNRASIMTKDHVLVRGSRAVLTSILAFSAQYEAARDLIEKDRMAVECSEHAHDYNLQDWLSNAKLGWINYLQGQFSEAETAQLQAVKAMDAYIGSFEHPVCLNTRTNLAAIYLRQGKWTKAVELDEHILSFLQKSLGDEHPDTITAMANLANVLGSQGKWQQARDIKQRVLELRTRLLGTKSFYTLEAMREVGLLDTYLGHFDKALEAFDIVLAGQKVLLGDASLQYLATLSDKCQAYIERGNLYDALTLQNQVHCRLEPILGSSHPKVIRSTTKLAVIKRALGNHDEALCLLTSVVVKREAAHGPLHPDTLNAKGLLADTLRLSRRLEEAKDLGGSVVTGLTVVGGSEHPDTVTAKVGLAQTLLALNKSAEALDILQKCVEWSAQTLGQTHTTTLRYKSTLAHALIDDGRYESSELLLQEVIDAREEAFDPEEPSLILCWIDMATCKMHQKDFDSAEQILQKIKGPAERSLGPYHPHTLQAHANLAAVAGEKGNLELAIASTKEVVRLRQSSTSAGGHSTLTDRNNLAVLLRQKGELDEAESLTLEVLQDSVREVGPKHDSTMRAWNNLAVVYTRQNRWREAKDTLGVVVETMSKTRGVEHPVTKMFDTNLRAVECQLEAEEAREKD